jgi:AcrR family transcriptional regulator
MHARLGADAARGSRVLPVAQEVIREGLVVGHHVEEIVNLDARLGNFDADADWLDVPDGTVLPVAGRDAKQRLLDGAIEYVAEGGIGDMSLRRLAAALGTSHRMLIHYFGSKEGLWIEIVRAVEQRQREILTEILPDPDRPPREAMRAWWIHISDPALWPNERLFFELYGQALQGRAHTTAVLDGIVEDWLEPIAQISIDRGIAPDVARAHARLGIAATRGLLLDLLATRDVSGVDAAMDAFIDIYDAWMQRAAT